MNATPTLAAWLLDRASFRQRCLSGLVSKSAPLTSRPTEGVCEVALIFHIESGSYDDTALDGLNVALAVHTPGPMAEGNCSDALDSLR